MAGDLVHADTGKYFAAYQGESDLVTYLSRSESIVEDDTNGQLDLFMVRLPAQYITPERDVDVDLGPPVELEPKHRLP